MPGVLITFIHESMAIISYESISLAPQPVALLIPSAKYLVF